MGLVLGFISCIDRISGRCMVYGEFPSPFPKLNSIEGGGLNVESRCYGEMGCMVLVGFSVSFFGVGFSGSSPKGEPIPPELF